MALLSHGVDGDFAADIAAARAAVTLDEPAWPADCSSTPASWS